MENLLPSPLANPEKSPPLLLPPPSLLGKNAIDPGNTGTTGPKKVAYNFKDNPTEITADYLEVDDTRRVFSYRGTVEVHNGDFTLMSKELVGKYSEQRQIQRLIAVGDVKITKGNEIKSNSGRADFDAATQVVTLTDNPELDKGGSTLAGDRIFIYLKENRSQAEGNVRMRLKGTDMGNPITAPGGSAAAPVAGVPLPIASATATVTPTKTVSPYAKKQ